VPRRAVAFFSGATRLAGDLVLPEGRDAGRRPGVLLCCGYTGTKDRSTVAMAEVLANAGFACLCFDYKGWGLSEGPPLRLAPYSRLEDTLAAVGFLSLQPEVDPERIGLYGIAYGGSVGVAAAAIDGRVKALVAVQAIGDGARWLRGVRTPEEYRALVERADRDRAERLATGASRLVDRTEVLKHDPDSARIAEQRRTSGAAAEIPLEFVDDTLAFAPEWVVERIAPRPTLFLASDGDQVVPAAETAALFARAGEPKQYVVLSGYGHYDVFQPPCLDRILAETEGWFARHL
jgi:pimeloyl-ACP methyl ester carboxylesterase